eukprot:gene4908-4800_t
MCYRNLRREGLVTVRSDFSPMDGRKRFGSPGVRQCPAALASNWQSLRWDWNDEHDTKEGHRTFNLLPGTAQGARRAHGMHAARRTMRKRNLFRQSARTQRAKTCVPSGPPGRADDHHAETQDGTREVKEDLGSVTLRWLKVVRTNAEIRSGQR